MVVGVDMSVSGGERPTSTATDTHILTPTSIQTNPTHFCSRFQTFHGTQPRPMRKSSRSNMDPICGSQHRPSRCSSNTQRTIARQILCLLPCKPCCLNISKLVLDVRIEYVPVADSISAAKFVLNLASPSNEKKTC